MKLVIKQTIPGKRANSNSSTKGGYLFELMDIGAVTMLNESFANRGPDSQALVTNSADVKYITPVFIYEYVEVLAEITAISPGSVTVAIVLNKRNNKSTEWVKAVTGNFSFSLIDVKTRRITRISREIINEIKG